MRIRWIALLAAGAAVAALTASSLSAAPGRASADLYDASLTGSQRSVVTRNGTTTDDFGCTVRHADRDLETIAFAGRKRVTLPASSRLPLIRFDLVARVSGSFHRATRSAGGGEDCVSAPTTSNRSCGPTQLPALLALRSGPGLRVRFDGGFRRARDRARCATTLTRPDRFIVPTEDRLERSPAGAERITLHGRLVRRTATRGARKTTTVDWKLVLTRA